MRKNKAFTLIELLVVIAIIGLLSSVVLVSMQGAREKAKIAQTKEQVTQIAKAMELYQFDRGELPPIGDNCSACSNPCSSSWVSAMDALVAGHYMGRIDKDAWGNYFCYDDNDNICCGTASPLWSMGPDGKNSGWTACPPKFYGDDIGIILPYGDRLCP